MTAVRQTLAGGSHWPYCVDPTHLDEAAMNWAQRFHKNPHLDFSDQINFYKDILGQA